MSPQHWQPGKDSMFRATLLRHLSPGSPFLWLKKSVFACRIVRNTAHPGLRWEGNSHPTLYNRYRTPPSLLSVPRQPRLFNSNCGPNGCATACSSYPSGFSTVANRAPQHLRSGWVIMQIIAYTVQGICYNRREVVQNSSLSTPNRNNNRQIWVGLGEKRRSRCPNHAPPRRQPPLLPNLSKKNETLRS
jgi:hypothetical protein